MAKEALLVIDMLNDFVNKGAPLEVPVAREIVPYIKVELQEAREAGIPRIFLCDSHRPDDKEFEKWPKHAVAGTNGAKIISELEPEHGVIEPGIVGKIYFISKTRYSGFYKTGLDLVLQELGIKKLLITGILTNVCVFCTAIEAVQRDYEVTILANAVAALTKIDNFIALEQMERVFKIKVLW